MQTDIVSVQPSANNPQHTKSYGQTIGEIIRLSNNLSADQVERILAYQIQHNVRFGEATVALGFANQADIDWALAQQFNYHYSKSNNSIAAEVVVAKKPFSDQAEIFRAIRGQLIHSVLKNATDRPALVMLSPNEGDGKSYFAANLAASLSQLGMKTLLIDANLRHPRQHEIFSIDGKLGLSGVLTGRNESHFIHEVQDLPSLFILPAGVVPPNPIELFERPTFGYLIADLKSKFDYIIVDAPSASIGSDARVLAAHCGAALTICRRDKTRMDTLQAMLSPFTINDQVQLAGIVVNEY